MHIANIVHHNHFRTKGTHENTSGKVHTVYNTIDIFIWRSLHFSIRPFETIGKYPTYSNKYFRMSGGAET